MKTENINARVAPETKAKLERIRIEYAKEGNFRSFTEIIESLIEREAKRLKLTEA